VYSSPYWLRAVGRVIRGWAAAGASVALLTAGLSAAPPAQGVAAAAPVVSAPLPPGRTSPGKLVVPAARADQAPGSPNDAEHKAVQKVRAEIATALGPARRAAGPRAPSNLRAAEAGGAALAARHELPEVSRSGPATTHGPAVRAASGPAVRPATSLAEVMDSDWVGELEAAEHAGRWGSWEMQHFLLYIDSEGCFEVVAQSWSLMPEERIE
jgi:hypothetical protein